MSFASSAGAPCASPAAGKGAMRANGASGAQLDELVRRSAQSGGGVGSGSLLDGADFAAIEEMDPSLAEGHRVVYDREVPFELRVQDAEVGPQEVGTLEAVRTKILVLGDEQCPHHCRMELTSENDLFFHYTHGVDEGGFRTMQEQQKLMVDFPEYTQVIIKMLNNCIKEPHTYLAVFVMRRDGNARLDFIQNMEYKFVELLSCDFQASQEDVVRQQVTFRYNSVKSRLALSQGRLQDISALVKVKNPSILLQLQKAPSRVGVKR